MWEWPPYLSVDHEKFPTSLEICMGLSKRSQCLFPLLQRWYRWVWWYSYYCFVSDHFSGTWIFKKKNKTKKQEKYWVLCHGYFCFAKYCVNSLADAWKVVFAGNNKVFISVSLAQNNLLFWNMAQVKMLDVYISLEELFHIIAWR